MLSAADVVRAFEVGALRGELDLVAHGQTNDLGVHRLFTERGAFAVKGAREAPRAVALAIEQAAVAAGIPMPRPLAARDGAAAARVGELWVRVYPWVEGEPGRWGDVDPRVSTEVGSLMARLHQLAVAAEHLVAEPFGPLGESGWRELAERARRRGLDWTPLLEQKVRWLVELEQVVVACADARDPLVPSHRDLHPPNLVLRADGTRVLVDWDAAGPAPATAEAAKFALVWATSARRPPQKALVQAFLAGYRAAGGSFDAGRDLFAYELRSRLSWIAFNVRRDASDAPGPDPTLTPALLGGTVPLSPADLERRADLFR